MVPGTLAAARAGCETKPPAAPNAEKPPARPGVYRSGNTEVHVGGYLRYEAGANPR